MEKSQLRAVRRFMNLKALRQSPSVKLEQLIQDSDGEDSFYRKGALCGAEYYQIAGTIQIIKECSNKAISEEDKQGLRWLILFILYQSGSGHIRIERKDLEEDFSLWIGPANIANPLDKLDQLLSAYPELFSSDPLDKAPILMDEKREQFYLLKRWRFEKNFLELLSSHMAERDGLDIISEEEVLDEKIQKSYDHLLASTEGIILSEKTKEAAKMVATHNFSIITGGPGTGKTTLLRGVLAILNHMRKSSGKDSLQVRLAAPTGRAAMRMQESLEGQSDQEAMTLHKLLGIRPGFKPRFHKNRPLQADLLVIDEASMVDLSMMFYVFDALARGARLLLLGDKDQLPSVEAGALLSDFLTGQENPHYRMKGAVLGLTQVHRNSGAILEGSKLVIQQNTKDFQTFISAPDRAVSQMEEGGFYYKKMPQYKSFVTEAAELFGLAPLLSKKTSSDEDFFQLYDNTVILTPSRKGLMGTQALNRGLIRHFNGGKNEAFHGMPIMISRNDYERELFNGDRGVVIRKNGQLYAEFQNPSRSHVLALLEDWEPAFAMTIHKSQGSEYGHVLLILAEGMERLLSREIFYTGITRAKKCLSLYSEDSVMEMALNRGVRRHSGIREYMVEAVDI